MKTVKLIAALMLVLAAIGTGCSGKGNVHDDVAVAHKAVADGDYQLARQSLQAISAELNDSLISPTLLSEVALLYMIICDNTGDGDDDMKAFEAFRHAVKINRDSVNAYMRTLPPDEAKFLFLLYQLNNAMDNAACKPGIMEEETETSIEAEAGI